MIVAKIEAEDGASSRDRSQQGEEHDLDETARPVTATRRKVRKV